MVAADVLFRTAANTAAAAWQSRPAYVSYRTHVEVNVQTYHRQKTIDRAIEMRTNGDLAAIQDLPRGKRVYGHAFPLDPTFDPLSYFELRFAGVRENYAWVQDVTPIFFTNPTPSPGVAVVSTTLRNYYTTFAADSTDQLAHIEMQPLRALTYKNPSDFYLHDVWIDGTTNIPMRVRYVGPETTFDVSYAVVNRIPVIDTVHYTSRYYPMKLHIAHVDFTVDAKNTDFAFPAMPSDPNLAVRPSPGAAPLPALTPAPEPAK